MIYQARSGASFNKDNLGHTCICEAKQKKVKDLHYDDTLAKGMKKRDDTNTCMIWRLTGKQKNFNIFILSWFSSRANAEHRGRGMDDGSFWMAFQSVTDQIEGDRGASSLRFCTRQLPRTKEQNAFGKYLSPTCECECDFFVVC
jgi:hypothetical protein